VPANLQTFADLCRNADEKLFNAITNDCNHVLHYLLPPESQGSQHCDLRQLPHNVPHLSNWPSHGQELHSTHAVFELTLALWLCIIHSILVHCFNVYISLYSCYVLSAVLINEYCIAVHCIIPHCIWKWKAKEWCLKWPYIRKTVAAWSYYRGQLDSHVARREDDMRRMTFAIELSETKVSV